MPNIANPKRYSERMLWRKIVDHNPLFVVFSDKLAAKDYCRSLCPELAIPRTLWIGNDADDIPDQVLNGNVYVKTTHGFNFNYFVRNGRVDRADLKRKTDRWLGMVHGGASNQWAYSMVEPKLFVEEAIGDSAEDLMDINIRAGNGIPILGSVIAHHKLDNEWAVYLDLEGNPTLGAHQQENEAVLQLPEDVDIGVAYREALEYTRRLSSGVDYARFDFMWNGEQLYAGEITVYPAAGDLEIANAKVHDLLVGHWDLRVSNFLRMSHSGWAKVYADALRRQAMVAWGRKQDIRS